MFRLAHLSDLHLSIPSGFPIRTLLNKRLLGYVSWLRRRRAEHRPEILATLVEDLAYQHPDHIVITGDLTHIALAGEIAQAADWLAALGPSSWVTVVPGNHDAYVPTSLERSLAAWAAYMNGGGGAGGLPEFPFIRIRAPLAVIGVSTAQPCNPFLATGRAGVEQCEKLEGLLVETGEKALFRVVAMHHPPLPRIVPWRRRLTDGSRFSAVVERAGAELVLHGHAHRASIATLSAANGVVPVIGARSSSALGGKPGRRAQYHLYDIEKWDVGWRVAATIRGYEPAGSRFEIENQFEMILPRRRPTSIDKSRPEHS